MKYLFLLFLSITSASVYAQILTVVDQDYDKALEIAKTEDKLIYIDFYTDWCGPCKKLDKLVFQNDSIQRIMNKNVVLLKYNAENDTVFHLSKKHHIFSFPMGVILNKQGQRINRMYAYEGEDLKSMSESVTGFIHESVELNNAGKYVKGYSAEIDPSIYPAFYADFVNRTNTKVDAQMVNDYLSSTEDVLSEPYFVVLFYFSGKINDENTDKVLENKDKYATLYDEGDVRTLTYFLAREKFGRAIEEDNEIKYKEAVAFAKQVLSPEELADMLTSFELDKLKAQKKWAELLAIYEESKEQGELSNGYINHISWQMYKECDDQEVIATCLDWMKVVVEEEPSFDYLDTYAFLLHKSGNDKQAKVVAKQAITVGQQEDGNTKNLEKLLEKL